MSAFLLFMVILFSTISDRPTPPLNFTGRRFFIQSAFSPTSST
jgi:hypothetical protein